MGGEMKQNKKREYEQAPPPPPPSGFVWERGEETSREFRLEKWGEDKKKEQQHMRHSHWKCRNVKEGELRNEEEREEFQQTTLARHQGLYGPRPWRGENCRMSAGKAPDELRHCHTAVVTAGTVGLSDRRRPAGRACLHISKCSAARRPQPLFMAAKRHVKLMTVV